MANTYERGDLVRCTGEFTNSAGTAIDPATVKFTLRTPAGAEMTYTYGVNAELVKDTTGEYHVDVDANAGGRWYYRFWSTGTGQAADEEYFDVVGGAISS